MDLAYGNDLLLFARGDEASISLVTSCLQHTNLMTQLAYKLNRLKSNIGVDELRRKRILSITIFQEHIMPFDILEFH